MPPAADNQPVPPNSPTPPASGPAPLPPTPPIDPQPVPAATPAPVAPVPATSAPAMTPPIAPAASTPQSPPPAPAKSKLGLIVGLVVGLILLLAGGYAVWAARSKQTPASTASVSSAPSVDTVAEDLNCGVTLSEYPNNPGKAYVMPDKWPAGFSMHDSGDEDSIREYCQGAKLKARAEEFIGALSSHDWNKAYSYLTKAEAAASPLATRKAQWQGEYGSYSFPPSNYPLQSPTAKLSYAIETCRKSFESGWSKSMQNGFYKTPFLELDSAQNVTTEIAVAMNLEDGVWKVVGDNNKLHSASGIIDQDAYSLAQNDRKFSNFWTCE